MLSPSLYPFSPPLGPSSGTIFYCNRLEQEAAAEQRRGLEYEKNEDQRESRRKRETKRKRRRRIKKRRKNAKKREKPPHSRNALTFSIPKRCRLNAFRLQDRRFYSLSFQCIDTEKDIEKGRERERETGEKARGARACDISERGSRSKVQEPFLACAERRKGREEEREREREREGEGISAASVTRSGCNW